MRSTSQHARSACMHVGVERMVYVYGMVGDVLWSGAPPPTLVRVLDGGVVVRAHSSAMHTHTDMRVGALGPWDPRAIILVPMLCDTRGLVQVSRG